MLTPRSHTSAALALTLAIAGGLLSVAALADRRPEIGPYAYVYRGPEGVQVTLLRIGGKDLNEVLIQVTGVDHELDGAILKHKVTPKYGNRGNTIEYVTPFKRTDWVTVAADDGGPGRKQLYLFLPGVWKYQGKPEQGHPLSYDLEASRALNREHFLTNYLENHAHIRW